MAVTLFPNLFFAGQTAMLASPLRYFVAVIYTPPGRLLCPVYYLLERRPGLS